MFHRFFPEPPVPRITPAKHPECPAVRVVPGDMPAILDRECARARRSGADLSLIVFSLEETPDGYTFASLVMWMILSRKHRCGESGWFDDRHIGVAMPGISPVAAARFAGEVCDAIPRTVRIGYSVFGYPSVWLRDYRDYSRASGCISSRTWTERSRADHSAIPVESPV